MNLGKRVEKLASKSQRTPTAEFVFVKQGETEEMAFERGKLQYPEIDQLILVSFISTI